MEKKETLSKYGKFFEERFVTAIITDSVFAEKCVDGFDISHIDCEYLSTLLGLVFDYYKRYRLFPSVDDITIIIKDKIKDESQRHLIEDFMLKCRTESPVSLQYVKDTSIEFMRNRAMKNAIHDAFEMVKEELYDDIPRRIEKALNLFSCQDVGHDYFSAFEYRTSTAARECIPTDWPEINERLKAHADSQGGLGKGELGVIIAPTGVGKSSALIHIGAAALKRGKTVAHYTLELHDTDVGLRYDACLTGFPINVITQQKETVVKRLQKYKDSRLIIREYPTRGASIQTIERHMELLRRNKIFPDLVIVDYADLLKISKSDQRYKDLEENYEELRRVAGEWKVPLWTASQGNRESYGARLVDITHIADSYGKACVGDVVMSIARTQQDKMVDEGRFYLLKSRFGPDGLIFPAQINLATVSFDVFPPETVDEVVTKNSIQTKESMKKIFNAFKEKQRLAKEGS